MLLCVYALRSAHGFPTSARRPRAPQQAWSGGARAPNWSGIQRLFVPDRNGEFADIVLGFDSEEEYAGSANPYFGVIVGRVANRIANATFTLDGEKYTLNTNEKGFPGSLHGGSKGFDKRKWNAEKLNPHARRHRRRGDAVRLSYSSADGEEGYPGTVQVQVVYSLSDSCTPLGASGRHETGDWHCVGELVQSITGWTTDKPTVLNLAQHSYFNLKGHGSGSVLDHELAMPTATRVLPVDSARIPTGEFKPVGGGAFDFLTSRRIGERISEVHGPGWREGYDHCFVLHSREGEPRLESGKRGAQRKLFASLARASGAEHPMPAADAGWWQKSPEIAATLTDPSSGRTMEIATTAPGLQVYTSNFLDGSHRGKEGAAYARYGGVCLEAESFPDGPNRGGQTRTTGDHASSYPSGVIRVGEVYRSTTVYQFSWR